MSKLVWILITIPVVYLLIAGALILSQFPQTLEPTEGGLNFSGVVGRGPGDVKEPTPVKMRDGVALPVRLYGKSDAERVLILLHGSGWHGMQFDGLAKALSDDARIVVPDLRGHGFSPERRGDIDHIGQFEEDIADLIDAVRIANQEVILLGHSSGGGLVVRFAGGKYAKRIDKAVLLAPYLKYDAPTMRPNSGGWTKPLTRRIIGLSMLNHVGIKAFNNLHVMQFTMPKVVLEGPLGQSATTSYSYRLNTGFEPRLDYLRDVEQLPPYLLIAGKQDEAFVAAGYEPLMKPVNKNGRFHLVEGVGHLDIVDDKETIRLMREFLGLAVAEGGAPAGAGGQNSPE